MVRYSLYCSYFLEDEGVGSPNQCQEEVLKNVPHLPIYVLLIAGLLSFGVIDIFSEIKGYSSTVNLYTEEYCIITIIEVISYIFINKLLSFYA